MSTITPNVYIRDAYPSEFEALARLEARAFVHDALLSWVGGLRQPMQLPKDPNGQYSKDLQILYYFSHSLFLATLYTRGRVLVVVERTTDDEKNEKEKLLSTSIWFPPGTRLDSPLLLLRSLQYRTIVGTWDSPWGWGFTGFWRAVFICQKEMSRTHREACNERGMRESDCWRVLSVATEPSEQKKGYCSMMLREGLEKIVRNEPAILEASSRCSRDVYARHGFKVTGESVFGKGEVTAAGFPPEKSKDSTEPTAGIPVWMMLRAPKN